MSEQSQNVCKQTKVINKVHGLVKTPVFGPVDSRRYGKSLGINLLPVNWKTCSYNCPYCECGPTDFGWQEEGDDLLWPEKEEVIRSVVEMLARIGSDNLDAITFAGNGEPTLHPDFPWIIQEISNICHSYVHPPRLVVLTNGTTLYRQSVREALLVVDEACFKVDSVSEQTWQKINGPLANIVLNDLLQQIKTFTAPVIQCLFIQGTVDNTIPEELEQWFDYMKTVHPRRVDIYSLDRPPHQSGLLQVGIEQLEEIAKRVMELGIHVRVF
jgi:wyosine [tRNA(Phe)-imidazoG37] synthetase (radical SAM superfamily)